MRQLLPRVEEVPLWPVIAAPVFLLLFIGIVWWVYRGDRKALYRQIERFPLEDDTNGKQSSAMKAEQS